MKRLGTYAKRVLMMMLALSMMLCAVTSAMADSYSAVVSASTMTVYGNAGLTRVVGHLPKDEVLMVTESRGNVARVTYQGRTGYVRLGDLDPVSSVAQKALIQASGLVYQYASYDSRTARIGKGAKVYVLGIENGWAKITASGRVGFVPADYVQVVTNQNPTQAPIIKETFAAKSTAAGNVYTEASLQSECQGVLQAGVQVTVYAYNGTWAYIGLNGRRGFFLQENLSRVVQQLEPEQTPSAPESNPSGGQSGIVYKDFSAIVTAEWLNVYTQASRDSDVLVSVGKGMVLQGRAYDDTWAMVEKNGRMGFVLLSGIAPYLQDEQPQQPEVEEEVDYSAMSGSNEEIIYAFLMREMNMNSAAACGVLANIYCESTFRPTALNPSGISYGICQWTYGRNTNLKNFCAENGYDYTTLEGQLWFLKHELETSYTKTLKALLAVENTPEGAYDAGYYWCYHFEVPANRASVSIKRGNLARDTYWEKYN